MPSRTWNTLAPTARPNWALSVGCRDGSECPPGQRGVDHMDWALPMFGASSWPQCTLPTVESNRHPIFISNIDFSPKYTYVYTNTHIYTHTRTQSCIDKYLTCAWGTTKISCLLKLYCCFPFYIPLFFINALDPYPSFLAPTSALYLHPPFLSFCFL